MKGQSADHWFQRCIEMGQSSARFPRLLLRLTYLPPGVVAPRSLVRQGSTGTGTGTGTVPSGAVQSSGSLPLEIPRTAHPAPPVPPVAGMVFNQGLRAEEGQVSPMHGGGSQVSPMHGGGNNSGVDERLRLLDLERSTWEKERSVLEVALQNAE